MPAEPPEVEVQVLSAVEYAASTAQQRVDAVLAASGVDVALLLPNREILAEGPRVGIQALTFTDQNRIVVYVRQSHTDDDLRRVVAHELGHAIDLDLLDDNRRESWRAERSIGGDVEWWPEAARNDFQTGAGDFAEAVADVLSGHPTSSKVAGPLDDGDRLFIAGLLGW